MARGESPILRRSIHESPRLRSSPGRNGSPSRSQLAEFELHRTIAQLSIATVEQQKVYNAQKTAFQEELDAREEALAVSQLSQIEKAIASHDLAREQAQAVLQAHLEAEREKELRRIAEQKRREEEEKRRKEESARLAKQEEERQIREQTEREEAAKRAEAERKRLEEERRQKAAEEADQREKDRQEQERRKAEADARAQAETRAAQEAKQREDEAARKAAAKVSGPANAEREHQSYLAIHKRLKAFRIKFWEDCKANKQYKAQVGEMRRAIRTAVGQLRTDGGQHNRVAVSHRSRQNHISIH
jgi:nucleoporin GLE1